MQNFGGGVGNIRAELPNGNIELGEAFSYALDDLIRPDGLANMKAAPYDIVSPSWKKLANSPDKTPEDETKLNNLIRKDVSDLAESYLLYIAKVVRNTTGKLTYADYEAFMLKQRFSKATISKDATNEAKAKIKNAFDKISSQGELDSEGKLAGDQLIDKKDMTVYLYALAIRMKYDEAAKQITGFNVNGAIEPREYALNEAFLYEDDPDNYMTLKLRIGYNFFYGVNKDK